MTAAGNTVVDLTPDEDVIVPTVELRGQRFAVRQQGVSLLALMKLATIGKRAKAGGAVDDMEALAAVYDMLRSAIDAADWPAFEDHANAVSADLDELQKVIADAVQAASAAQREGSARPTQPPPGSPAGQSRTAPSSAAQSSAPGSSPRVRQGDPRVQADLEARGRPDLALVVKRAREASTTSSPR